MKCEERRKEIIKLIKSSIVPTSGTVLAKHFHISRQVIVQDIAVLRAEGYNIISTNRGYILHASPLVSRVVKVAHSDSEIADELNSIVDCGGIIKDVFVNHKAYGELRAPLNISSRRDVETFLEQIRTGKSTPLKNITSGYHYHTIEAKSLETLDIVEKTLERKGYLIKKTEYNNNNSVH